MVMSMSSYSGHCESSPVHAMNAEIAPVAANLWSNPIVLSHKPACRQPVNMVDGHCKLLIPHSQLQ